MKAISPLIAAILLIAFTVAVAGIISIWLIGFTRTATVGTEARTEALTRCSGSGFEVISASATNQRVSIAHYGSGLTLYPISLAFSDGSINTTFTSSGDRKIDSAEVETLTASNFPSTATYVLVRALCEYGTVNISIEAKCSEGEDCWI